MTNLSSIKELEHRKRELEEKKEKLLSLTEKGVSWEIVQPRVEECEGEIKKIEEEMMKRKLGIDEMGRLTEKKEKLEEKLSILKIMKEKGEISEKIYKEKKREIKREIEEVERRIVDLKLSLI